MLNLFTKDFASKRIQRHVKNDRFGNSVSVITLIDGQKLNMVHRDTATPSQQHATIYAGPGKYVIWRSSNGYLSSASVAGYEIHWDELCRVFSTVSPANGPDLKTTLRQIHDHDLDGFLITVLTAIIDTDHLWSIKQPRLKKLPKANHVAPYADRLPTTP